jgi:hypothetical protein
MKPIIVAQFTHAGLNCLIIETDLGYLCGYVAVPSDNPLYEMDYTNSRFPDLEVHGGVTYSSHMEKEGPWLIGFDCAHWGDAPKPGYRGPGARSDGVYRNEAYVANECRDLAEQVVKVRRVEITDWKLEVGE